MHHPFDGERISPKHALFRATELNVGIQLLDFGIFFFLILNTIFSKEIQNEIDSYLKINLIFLKQQWRLSGLLQNNVKSIEA